MLGSQDQEALTAERAADAPAPGLVTRAADWLASIELSTLIVALGVFLGVFVRASYTFSADFPLNDGGLFFEMARDLQRSNYALPDFTPYNGASIPFAYPPLGFYLSALIDDLTPLNLFDVFRFLPLVASCATILAFYALARDVLKTKAAVVVAVFSFALVPRSFIWLIMGGGVTRALGLLFALLALHQIYLMYTRGGWRSVAAASVLAQLTALSHLQTASFLAFSAVLFFFLCGVTRRNVLYSVVVGIATVVLTAPWWGSVVAAHGLEPFRAASQTGGSIFTSDPYLRQFLIESLLRLGTTSEPLFPLIATLAFLGTLVCIVTHRFLLPAWWAAIILLDARAFPTFATVPVALLAGIGLTEMILPMMLKPLRARWWRSDSADDPPIFAGVSAHNAMLSWAPILLAIFLWYSTNGALMRAGETPSLVALSAEEREAMAWVSRETAPDSRFLIITAESWPTDKTGEWFPLLANRVSVATVQGYEWIEGGEFAHRTWMHDQAQGCAYGESACIAQWRKATATPFDYVLISKPWYGQCCQELIASMSTDVRFRQIYNGPGATIFEFRG